MDKSLYEALCVGFPYVVKNDYHFGNQVKTAYCEKDERVIEPFERNMLGWLNAQRDEDLTLNEYQVKIQCGDTYVYIAKRVSGEVRGTGMLRLPVMYHVFDVRVFDTNDGTLHDFPMNDKPGIRSWWEKTQAMKALLETSVDGPSM